MLKYTRCCLDCSKKLDQRNVSANRNKDTNSSQNLKAIGILDVLNPLFLSNIISKVVGDIRIPGLLATTKFHEEISRHMIDTSCW